MTAGQTTPPASHEHGIAPLAVDRAKDAAATVDVPDYMADLRVFQVLLHHPKLAKRINDLLAQLLFDAELPTRLRELAIMRIGWNTASDYEWTQHWRIALQLGVPEADVLGVRDWRDHAGFDGADRAILAAADDVHATGAIGADAWAACTTHISADPAVLLEAAATLGTWTMVSTLLRSLGVPLEDGVDSWPPDGRAPADAS